MHRRSSIIIIALIVIFSIRTRATEDRLLFRPLLANPLDARVGVMVQLPDKSLRLDIGHSFDLMSLDSSASMQWRAGGDFATYTRLRSEGRLKFPVETVDYYFGVNTSVRWTDPELRRSLRVRIAHISAHLADGLANDSAVISPKPFVYSREFIEAIYSFEWTHWRLYGGLTWVFSNHVHPPAIRLLIPQAGVEYRTPVSKGIEAYAAYDIKLSGIENSTSLVHAAQAGLAFQQMNGYQLLVGAYYYHGLSLHGLFYNTVDDYIGLGFQVSL